MIDHIEIRNFQSLSKVDVDLAPFTVVVGQSSSGKSAFVRALSTLVSNRRGTDFISHGTSTSVITATLPQGKVSLSRSTTAAKNMYTLIPSGEDPNEFTKLGGDTPPEVSSFLKVEAKDTVVLAQQFDKPFLLADSPAQAAQTLGSLTNVHVIFESAREANRLRLNATQTLRTKTADLLSIEEKLSAFTDLEGKEEALNQAESALVDATRAQTRLTALEGHIQALRGAKGAIQAAQPIAEMVVPSIQPIEDAHARLLSLTGLIADLKASTQAVRTQTALITDMAKEETDLEDEYQLILHDLGTCPTCGQATV